MKGLLSSIKKIYFCTEIENIKIEEEIDLVLTPDIQSLLDVDRHTGANQNHQLEIEVGRGHTREIELETEAEIGIEKKIGRDREKEKNN